MWPMGGRVGDQVQPSADMHDNEWTYCPTTITYDSESPLWSLRPQGLFIVGRTVCGDMVGSGGVQAERAGRLG